MASTQPPRGDIPPMQLPLEDIKILDLSHALAGPFCSTMLGDFGAHVLKVEVPGAGAIAGEPGSRGVRNGVSIADMVAGMWAAFGIMNALRVKEKTGQGQYVDVSMLEGQLGLLQSTIGSYMADGEVPEPMGTAYKALLPYQTFRTKTKDLALAVGS